MLELRTCQEGEIAYNHIVKITGEFGARADGTSGAKKCADYILKQFAEIGYNPSVQSFEYLSIDSILFRNITAQNIVAYKPGLSTKAFILCAHYDSVDDGVGADDNASGIGVLLELAQRLKDVETPYSIIFVAFDSEEDGMHGSHYYAAQMTQDEIDNTMNVINLDSLIAGNNKYVYGNFGPAGFIRDYALKVSNEQKLGLITQMNSTQYKAGTTGSWGDHAPFAELGIPHTFFEATDWRLGRRDGYTQADKKFGEHGEIWHTKYDNLNYINLKFPGRAKEHLCSFVKVLINILTKYKN